MIFTMTKKVYGFECDIYGHLNNANYLQVFEAARSDALTDMEVPIHKFSEMNIQLFVARVEIEYKKGVQLEDIITVKSCMTEANRLGSFWKQEIFDSKGNLCAKALLRAVHTRDAKPFRIEQELANYFIKFVEKSE